MSVSLRLYGSDWTDQGPHHEQNADGALLREDLGLFAVARGSGTEARAALAREIALSALEEQIAASVEETLARPDRDVVGLPEQAKRLSRALHRAGARLREKSESDPELGGLVASVTAVLESPRGREINLAHVGDGRCYRLRHGRLELLTRDQTLAQEVLETRPETPESVLVTLQRNSVVAALGLPQDLRVSMSTLTLAPDDRFILCSCGVHGRLPGEILLDLIREGGDRHSAAERLVQAARAHGGKDDMAVLVIDAEELEHQEETTTRPYNERPEP